MRLLSSKWQRSNEKYIARRTKYAYKFSEKLPSRRFGLSALVRLIVTGVATVGNAIALSHHKSALCLRSGGARRYASSSESCPVSLNHFDVVNLLQLARTTIVAVRADVQKPEPKAIGVGAPFRRVNVTISTRGGVRASMSGRGRTLTDAVIQAAERAATDHRFGEPLTNEELRDSHIHLWIEWRRSRITNVQDVDLGLHGVELRQGGRAAYFKPSVALTSRILVVDRLLDKLAKKAGLSPGGWRLPGTEIRKTYWLHFTEREPSALSALRLSRFRPVEIKPATTAQIRRCLRLSETRLVRIQQSDGFFLYRYHPFRPLAPKAVQLVRQAGCAFALSLAAHKQLEDNYAGTLTATAERAISRLLEYRCVADHDGLYIREPADRGRAIGKLGSTALLLAALQYLPAGTPFIRELRELRRWILSMQRADGSFRCRTDSVSVQDDGAAQNFFPGEALVALCSALRYGTGEVYPAIVRSLPWYSCYFRQRPSTAFVLWQVEAWRLLADWMIDNGQRKAQFLEPAAFVFEMVDWLLQFQIVSDSAAHPDFIGGFTQNAHPPHYGTAAYTEAVIRAFGVAARTGAHDRAARYRAAAQLGLQFIMRLQITRETASLFPDPERTVGGTTHSLSNLTMRCDYDQHAITAYLAAFDNPALFEDPS